MKQISAQTSNKHPTNSLIFAPCSAVGYSGEVVKNQAFSIIISIRADTATLPDTHRNGIIHFQVLVLIPGVGVQVPPSRTKCGKPLPSGGGFLHLKMMGLERER